MEIKLSRGAVDLRVELPEELHSPQLVFPLTAPADDLIGLRADPEYLTHLVTRYLPLFGLLDLLDAIPPGTVTAPPDKPITRLAQTLEPIGKSATEAMAQYVADELPEIFLAAAAEIQKGHFPTALAPYFERIHREPDLVEVYDVPTLAAYGLDEAMRRDRLELRECRRCTVPFLAAIDSDTATCLRPAPARNTLCRVLEANERVRKQQGAYRREYRKLHARVGRGTFSPELWEQWKRENSPDEWLPLEQWLEQVVSRQLADAAAAEGYFESEEESK